MKVLLLNPEFDTLRRAAEALRQQGAIVLEVSDAADVMSVLAIHGRTVDLAILHREGASGRGDLGAALVRDIRSRAEQADLPLILTSQNWGDPQFAQHQSSPQACHAYLKLPSAPEHFARLAEGVLGTSLMELRGRGEDLLRSIKKNGAIPSQPRAKLTETGSIEIPLKTGLTPAPAARPSAAAPMIILEDATGVYTQPGLRSPEGKSVSITLEAPAGRKPKDETPSVDLAPPVLADLQPPSAGSSLVTLDLPATSLAIDPGRAQDLIPEVTPAGPISLAPDASGPVPDRGVDLASRPFPEIPSTGEGPPVFSTADENELRRWMQPPVDDAIVPGGAAQSPDVATLKKYLLLREQDVAALSSQLRSARQRVQSLDGSLEFERARSAELAHQVESAQRREADFELEKQALRESFEAELGDVRLQLKARADRARLLEMKVKEASDETELLRERVRQDLRRIRVREQELENRLELLKRDSETQLASREEKLNEVRRRADLMEFNYELVQTQLEKERELTRKIQDQLNQFSRMVKMAGGLLEGDSLPDEALDAFASNPTAADEGRPGSVGGLKKPGRAA